jgi:hypothetical protein
MELTLSTGFKEGDTFYWDVPFPSYKIDSVKVVAKEFCFKVKYNNGAIQYLESGRPDDCPCIFTGKFSAFFYEDYAPPITDISEITFKVVHVDNETL